MINNTNKAGFSLVELAVSLVIIALIFAGIAAGSSIIRQSQMRSVITDLQSFQVAYTSFGKIYYKVPGDMDTASNLWWTACAVTYVNCNGDGDFLVEWANNISSGGGDEVARAWKHLSLAGLIKPAIAVIPNGYNGSLTLGSSAPGSNINNVGYFIQGPSALGGTAFNSPWNGDNLTNAVFVGATNSSPVFLGGAFTGDEAFNIDRKIDDAMNSGSTFSGNSTGKFRVVDVSGSSACVSGGNYAVGSSVRGCVLGLSLISN
jgi:prepilin-type N-terminal cleavage/methylation domain-containing protein